MSDHTTLTRERLEAIAEAMTSQPHCNACGGTGRIYANPFQFVVCRVCAGRGRQPRSAGAHPVPTQRAEKEG